ncbi:MAG: HK97 gp10 family phage protein [Paraclostridium sp.]
MARWGSCDFRQLQKLQQNMQKLESIDLDLFCKQCAKELAARLLRKVIKRTPVGQYPSSTGKVGGTLRRGWTGNQKINPMSYANSLPITKIGTNYHIEIINPTEYASYVEYGRRTSNHKGWVKGRFMLTISEMELESQAERIIEKKLMKFLGEYFNVE